MKIPFDDGDLLNVDGDERNPEKTYSVACPYCAEPLAVTLETKYYPATLEDPPDEESWISRVQGPNGEDCNRVDGDDQSVCYHCGVLVEDEELIDVILEQEQK